MNNIRDAASLIARLREMGIHDRRNFYFDVRREWLRTIIEQFATYALSNDIPDGTRITNPDSITALLGVRVRIVPDLLLEGYQLLLVSDQNEGVALNLEGQIVKYPPPPEMGGGKS